MIDEENALFTAEEAHDLLRDLASGICYRNTDLEIETIPAGSSGTRLLLKAHRSEFGKLIGKQGAHVKAMECIFKEIGRATNGPIFLNFLEPDKYATAYDSATKNNFNSELIQDLIWRVIEPVNNTAIVRIVPIDATSTAYEVTPARDFPEDFREAVRVLFNAIGRAYDVTVDCTFVD